MRFSPDPETFVQLAERYSVVPVAVEVLADRDTPVTVFEKLVGDEPGFLLESVEGGENWARWSFVGWDAAFTLRSHSGVSVTDDPAIEVGDGDPLSVLEALLDRYRVPDLPGLPPLHSGVVGYLAYDTVRYIERLPDAPVDDRRLPEMLWQFV
ncbi:MAG: anthranilate synthase component I, partial [Acidimicrobiia bacterium]|nr:anthranilate synthase component I [Acidimicrobiia bacterium]